MSIYVKITPLDTLFFRDGKPFHMGSDSWAEGIFPPYPSTILGALRSWYIINHPNGPTEDVINSSINDVQILQIAYYADNEIYYPMPKDYVLKEDSKSAIGKIAVSLNVKSAEAVVASNYPCSLLLLSGDSDVVKSDSNGLFAVAFLKSYLNDNCLDEIREVVQLEDYYVIEPKTGIGRDNDTITAKDSMLYRVGMIRTRLLSFIVEINLPADSLAYFNQKKHIIKLGAENKFAKMEMIEDEFLVKRFLNRNSSVINITDEDKKNSCQFRIYLNTPGIFENGWRPNLSRYGIDAELACAAVGKPLYIGGYDMKEGRPKPMLRAVPAGSVYYYKSNSVSFEEVVNKLNGKALSEPVSYIESNGNQSYIDPGREGYGIAYVGRWKN